MGRVAYIGVAIQADDLSFTSAEAARCKTSQPPSGLL